MQWIGGPRWARSHDHLASVSAAVVSGGRLFYIVDEGPTAAVILNPQWRLVARGAFNGVILWKRAIPNWQWHLRTFRGGPSDLARRLVAVGERVYVTLSIDGPLCALDAATGRTVRTYENTQGTMEVVFSEGVLYVVAGTEVAQEQADRALRRGERPGFTPVRPQKPAYPENPPPKRLMAIEAEAGRLLWKKADEQTDQLMPTTLAISRDRVFFQNAQEIMCLDAGKGREIWRAPRPVSRQRPTWSAPTLVVYKDVVLSAERAVRPDGDSTAPVEWLVSSAGGQAPVGELIAFSARDGTRLWSTECQECYNAPVDVLVANGLVWSGNLVRAKDPGITRGLDPLTGAVKQTRPQDREFFAAGMGHQRCYRNKATNRYLVLGRSGVELVDLATGEGIANHWTRGTCQYGVIPCNGLLYVPPHSCARFTTAKLNGFNCFSPRQQPLSPTPANGDRLERGPAFAQISASASSPGNGEDWPTYRHDPARSGATMSAVPAKLEQKWQTELAGKLSSVVVADGLLFVADSEAQTVHALSTQDGRNATVNGVSPTIKPLR